MTSVWSRKQKDEQVTKPIKDKGEWPQLRQQYSATACGEVSNRVRTRVVGEVTSTRLVPRAKGHWFEIVINDGTGKIDGWFFGRKSIAGMNLGTKVLLEGLVQLDQGELTIANPYYEIL